MILLSTDRPDRFRGIERAITLKSVRMIPAAPEHIRAILTGREEEPHAVLCDIGTPADADQAGADLTRLTAIAKGLGDLIPVVVVFDREGFQVPDLLRLTDRGFVHFRAAEDLFAPEIDSYLYRLIQQYESRQIIQGVRTFFIDQVVRDELVRTHGLLDSLESGIMIVTPAFKNQDFLIHNVNETLELLFESDLRAFENRTLGELCRSPEVSAEVRAMFRVDLYGVFDDAPGGPGKQARHSVLLPIGPGGYVERVISPFYQPDGGLAGYVLIFQDMSFEVERGLIDRVTGLVSRDQLERALIRRMRRLERFGRQPCRDLGAILVGVRGLDPGNGLRQTAGGESREFVEYVVRKAAQSLSRAVRNSGVVCRSGRAEFIVAVPGLSRAEMAHTSRAVLSRLREIYVQAGPVEFNAGVVHEEFQPGPDDGDPHGSLYTLQNDLANRIEEARRALHRARESGANVGVLYTRQGGYTQL